MGAWRGSRVRAGGSGEARVVMVGLVVVRGVEVTEGEASRRRRRGGWLEVEGKADR